MVEQGTAGPYRASWDLMPVLRVFMEAIRPQGEPEDEDSEAVKQMKATLAGVRASLRDAVDPELVLAVDEDTSAVNDAIHDLLFSDPGCEALAPLHEATRRVREGDEGGFPDTPVGPAVTACVGQHGGDHCSAGRFLLALFHDCRREGREHCLGVPLLHGGGEACRDFSRLDDAARRCLALNGVRCHAADDLDEPEPGEGDGEDEAAEEAEEGSEIGAGEGEEEGEAGEADAQEPVTAGPAETVMDAVWGWARRYNLVADQATLRRVEAEFGEDPLLPEMAYHSSLLQVAYRSLRAWASSPEARAELSWHYPEHDNVEFDDAALCLFHGLPDHVSPGEDGTEDEFVCRQVDTRQDDTQDGDHRRYEIVFRPAKWNPFEETPAAAAKRIKGAFEKHLDRMLAAHHKLMKGAGDAAARAKEVGDVVPASRELDAVHARWLVIYQISGLPKSTIGEIDPQYKGQDRELKQLSELVGGEIRKAAELLLGPRYELWLRPSRDGRPPGSTNKPAF